MLRCCIVNNDVVNIAIQFEPDWDPENISEEDRAEPVQAQLLQDISEFFIFLDTLLFVNATTYLVRFKYMVLSWVKL